MLANCLLATVEEISLSKFISRDHLTAYEPWNLPAIDLADDQGERQAVPAVAPTLTPLDSLPLPSLPTLEKIEAIQREAQEEGFATGYQEGRKEGHEQGYKKGHQEGHEEGYQVGFDEGLKAGQDEVLTQVEKLSQILDFMSRPLDKLDAIVEDELVLLTTLIARQLIRRELKTAPGEIVAVVRQAVGLLPVASQEVCVHLHPEDARLVREALALKGPEQSWHIQEDPTLSRGGCQVSSALSRIDASVETRLGAVIATVLGDEREHHHDHG